MGVGGISIWQLLIILVIVLLLFGTKKVRGMGGDLGTAIKSFRKSMKEGDDKPDDQEAPDKLEDETNSVIDDEVTSVHKDKA